MAYKMKEFGGFKSSPKAKSFSKGLDMTLNDNLNKAVRTQNFRDAGNKTKTVSSKTNVGNKVVDAKEFLKKKTLKYEHTSNRWSGFCRNKSYKTIIKRGAQSYLYR